MDIQKVLMIQGVQSVYRVKPNLAVQDYKEYVVRELKLAKAMELGDRVSKTIHQYLKYAMTL